MPTELGEVTSYKRLYMQFRDSAAKTINLTLNNPKNVDDGFSCTISKLHIQSLVTGYFS